MSVSVNLGITSALGKKSTKAYTDINPYATNSQIVAFADAVNNLTTNSLTSMTKIIKDDLELSYSSIVTSISADDSNLSPTRVDNNHYSIPKSAFAIGVVDDNYYYFHLDLKVNNIDADFTTPGFMTIYDNDNYNPLACMPRAPGSSTYYRTLDIGFAFGQAGNSCSFTFTIPSQQLANGLVVDSIVIHFDVI